LRTPKISIKTSFWKKDLTTQRDKLVNILFLGNVFFISNIAYFIFNNNVFMMVVNLLISLVFTLIHISYNKREQ
jgi:hypothetical protein